MWNSDRCFRYHVFLKNEQLMPFAKPSVVTTTDFS